MYLHELIAGWYGETTYQVLALIVRLYPLWLPVILGVLFWESWITYIRYLFFSSTAVTLLEIKLPKTLTKSPVAMELVINGFYQTGGESTVIARNWEGKTRAWFSLEIASFGGELHFYVWTRNNMRQIVEAHIYAQFPEVEVREVEDYTKTIVYDTKKYDMWAANYELTRPDPFPIKTYMDYGLDRNPKLEHETDPIGTVLEVLNNIKPQEQIWLQFVIRAHKSEKRMGIFSKKTDWSSEVDKQRRLFIESAQAEKRPVFSPEESKIIDAFNRSIQKPAFDTGIRVMYIAEAGGYYNNTTVVSLRGLFRPFSANFATSFKEQSELEEKDKNKPQKHYAAFNGLANNDSTDTDYPWEDYKNIRMDYQKRRKLDAFKRRMFFYAPYKEKNFVMTSEALATLYHFPTASVTAPGLERIQSKRGQAPSNLPV